MSRSNGRKPEPFNVDKMLADALVSAKGAVAQAALENRPALEMAIADAKSGGIREWQRQADDLQEILDALDEWHRASMALTQDPPVPQGRDDDTADMFEGAD